jgi:hypothetical protein
MARDEANREEAAEGITCATALLCSCQAIPFLLSFERNDEGIS